MKRYCVLTIMAFILSFPLFVSAHGDATHVLGTVTETAQDHIVVQTRQGKSVTLVINADTIFQRDGMTTKGSAGSGKSDGGRSRGRRRFISREDNPIFFVQIAIICTRKPRATNHLDQ